MSTSRARTRAIRERMARTGEPWNVAARANDLEYAAKKAAAVGDAQHGLVQARANADVQLADLRRELDAGESL